MTNRDILTAIRAVKNLAAIPIVRGKRNDAMPNGGFTSFFG
jgi:hypothetical protein